ncbi:glycosyl hydrolase family 18 protein [Listeria rocourtiae]|uniref:glycosyl hydrolase family 18 protein n=1 Tax=Listeria rocourtiae TaxID=647910 RepID=UPI003D2F9567
MTKSLKRNILTAGLALILLLTSIIAFTTHASAALNTQLKPHVNIGYWLGGNGGSKKTLAQASSGWDVINVSFIETKGNYYTPNLSMDLSAVYSGTEAQQIAAFKADIKTLQAQGKKIVISCGGQNGVVHMDNTAQRDTFLNGVKNIINEYGFDGFDVDFEGSSIAVMSTDKIGNLTSQQSINLEYLLRNLKTTYGPDFIISAAPEYCYVQNGAISTGNGGAFLPVLNAARDILTYIHPQYYNGFNGDFAWLQPSANAGAPFAQVYSAEGYTRLSEMLITGFVTMDKGTFAGLRPDQVAFGVPSTTGAGNGAQSVSVYASALNTLLGKYPTYRGIMTWSIGWDEANGNNFVNTIAPIIKAANDGDQTSPNAKAPTISSQPTDKTVKIGETADLTVVSSVSKGTLSYQWYKAASKVNTGGTAISGATSTTYNAPTSAEGTNYYYCVVTNTDNSATGTKTATTTSNAVSVVVSNTSNAAIPTITSQPTDKSVTLGGTASLSIGANVPQGALSYQWYKASSKVNTGGTAISGATSATYNASTSVVGTSYYYCIVTNTDSSATGTSTVSSNAVTVIVSSLPAGDTWKADAIYVAGDTAIYQGKTYKAKWWTQGDVPGVGEWGPWELVIQ